MMTGCGWGPTWNGDLSMAFEIELAAASSANESWGLALTADHEVHILIDRIADHIILNELQVRQEEEIAA